ncbi:MAG: DnaA/Hda family protein, partial [Rhodothermales bacterium]
MPPTAAEKTWENCLSQISGQISKQSFQTWFVPITPIDLERDDETARLKLAVPDAFHTEWLESHFAKVLRQVAADVVGQHTDIAYEVTPDDEASKPDLFSQPPPNRTPKNASAARSARANPAEHRAPSRNAPASRQEARTRNAGSAPQPPVVRQPVRVVDSRLKPEYTFESFIEGDCNRLARSASVAISQNPGGTSFNPFMVYGGVGLGKTHIVQAVGNYVTKEKKAERVLYVSSEQFTSQFVRSIQENRVSDFSNFYRQI